MGVSIPMQEGEDDVYCVPNLNSVASSQARTETLPRPRQLSSLTLDFSSPGTPKQPCTRPVFTPAECSKSRSAFIWGNIIRPLVARGRREGQRHPKWETRQLGDSDVDWGTDGEGDRRGDVDEVVDEVSNGAGGMDLDPDLELSMDAMKQFLMSMGMEESHFVTMDDIEDEARICGPTGNSDSPPSEEDEDGEEHEQANEEEELLIAESEAEVNPATDDNNGEGFL
ncbi:hypothetical protein BU15DRAFT_75386 [Melanogaster broomeanus]|nr:hypothetical protein BU15DRAFT_75386 [Melanogaster broomeanus]